jgi:hypothetical protein
MTPQQGEIGGSVALPPIFTQKITRRQAPGFVS